MCVCVCVCMRARVCVSLPIWPSYQDLQDTILHPLWVGYSATNHRKLKHAFNCDFGHLITGHIYIFRSNYLTEQLFEKNTQILIS